MLQSLAGASEDDVLFDYMISRIGIETQRERMMSVIKAGVGTLFKGPGDPGLYNLASLRPVFWTAFMEDFNSKYGGWDAYVTGEQGLGFSQEDLETIKRNLRGEQVRSSRL